VTLHLVVVAVAAERDAVLAGLGDCGITTVDAFEAGLPDDGVHILAAGVGVAAAAARTAQQIAARRLGPGRQYDAVFSVGIAGAYPGRARIGDTVIGTSSVAADLGADPPYGFLTLSDLGFGSDTVNGDPALLDRLGAALPTAERGKALTVHTVTGTAARAAGIAARHPTAVTEAMEGYGVAVAAQLHAIPFAEVRTVSNLVGPRDRSAWRMDAAMAALTRVGTGLATLVR
jgi:futalosine hydrolase